MAFTAIASTAVAAGKAVTTTLMSLIKSNFDDHESRIVTLEAATIVNGFIVGEIRIWTSSSLPTGFLWCDGSAVSRTVTYDDLYAVIGTTFGIGDGSTTYNLPDLRGRIPVGKDDMDNTVGTGGGAASRVTSGGSGVDGATLGAVGGEQTHTLTTAELATHGHGVTDPGHSHSVTDPGHQHALLNQNAGGGGSQYISPTGSTASSYTPTNDIVNTHTTGLTVDSNTTGLTVNNNGSSSAHNNMQPSLICNFIIRYLAS